ncbi:MAG: GNAT family N-acetyltransferase [Hyphomicrobiales bacterium]
MPKIETTVTMLEMRAEPLLHVPPPAIPKLMLMRAEQPSADFYHFLYDGVGRDLAWVDRKRLSQEDLLTIIHDERVAIWVAYSAGQPAGYFEVDQRALPSQVELEYFGLLPAFRGRGLGKWLLAEAIRACWAGKPERVIVETCTLDGPAALPLYQKMGFAPYARLQKVIETDA